MKRHFIRVFSNNPVIRAEAIKKAKEVCEKCFTHLHGDFFVVKINCTDNEVKKLDKELSDVISPKLFIVR